MVKQLEGKVSRLEEKELQQELLIEKLKKEREISSFIGENSVGKSVFFSQNLSRTLCIGSVTQFRNALDRPRQGVGDLPQFRPNPTCEFVWNSHVRKI